MSDSDPSPRFPNWIGVAVVTLLSLQLCLSWVQGRLLHRQHREIQDLREDVQSLSDTIEQTLPQDSGEDTNLAPMRSRIRRHRHTQQIRMVQENPPQEEDPTKKELEESRKSAQKAVAKARDVQSKLSIEENARKAEEKQKIEGAQNSWQKWLWIALGVGLLAVVVRSWLRRRG